MARKHKHTNKKKRKISLGYVSIGYALPQKKIQSLITPFFVSYAKKQGINLIPVDLYQPLHYPPLDCLIHKPYREDWVHHLLEFQAKYPNVLIIDLPSAINRICNRDSMLNFILKITLPPTFSAKSDRSSFGIPSQKLLLQEHNVSNLSFKFPLIAKPLDADCHQLSLVFNSTGLQKVQKQGTLVLQEFVNHGGVMFKVYVAGKHVKCVQRKSLPDLNLSNLSVEQLKSGVFPFTRVSNLPTANAKSTDKQAISMPSLGFVQNLATAIRETTKLQLFNFDLILDESQIDGNNKYLIIDINYFPAYEKLPEFEAMLTNFFLDVVRKNRSQNLNLLKSKEMVNHLSYSSLSLGKLKVRLQFLHFLPCFVSILTVITLTSVIVWLDQM